MKSLRSWRCDAFVLLVLVILWPRPLCVRGASPPPKPQGALPSLRQLEWQELEFYGFIHFTVNTFTDKEWGYGDENPAIFNPSSLETRQWAQVARDAGMRGLILTAKHHDGFCLWPSRYTEHSVKHSPWRNGRGDVVGELAEACREFGLKFGVYLSPWDRNHPDYARPEYLTYYRNQLRELLTQYGPIFEVWFDGANGGDGFYGGARERRRIDNSTYYDWPNTHAIVREHQPLAVMFSDAGPDIRWVGNERGFAFETTWMSMNRQEIYPGYPEFAKYAPGRPDGTDWVPPEVDVSIRPGWFYHPAEDAKVKTVDQLLEIYYASVGRSANLLLNLPPDRRGLIHEIDAQRLRDLREILDATFKTDLARNVRVTASNTRGDDPAYAAALVNDGDLNTYWATDDATTGASLTFELDEPTRISHVLVREHVPLGQRVEQWNVQAEVDGQWQLAGEGTTIGYRRILKFDPITTRRIRMNIVGSRGCPAISTISIY
jgi:alpha-L-fucosidase